MEVKLKVVTPNAEQNIVEIARVSSSRKDKSASPEKLINYLIKNKHWSPFEHGFMTIEIETSVAIGRQILRHRSFTFQEFSQRYQDVSKHENMFQPIELREQASDNRQSSTNVFDPMIFDKAYHADLGTAASEIIHDTYEYLKEVYSKLLEAGVARECARMVLPMATTTKLYMTGSVRSWIHFLQIRDDSHAQKEAQELAKAIKIIFNQEFPAIASALGWTF